MAISSAIGNLNITTGAAGTTVSVTGLSFQPKVLILWWNGLTAASNGTRTSSERGMGWAVSASSFVSLATFDVDAVGTSDVSEAGATDGCVLECDIFGAITGKADLQSFNSDGFTLEILDAFTTSKLVSYLAIGGSDITDAEIGTFTAAGVAPVNQTVNNVGNFQPTITFFLGPSIGSTAIVDSKMFFGVAMDSSNEAVHFSGADDAATSGVTNSCNLNNECITLGSSTPATINNRAEFVSHNTGPGGFTINWLERGTAPVIASLSIRGGSWAVGDLLTATSLTTIAETGLGFTPDAVLFVSAGEAEAVTDTPSTHDKWSVGAARSASDRVVQQADSRSGNTTMFTHLSARTDCVYVNTDPAQTAHTVLGLMDIQSFDADGFTCVMDDADPTTQRFVWWVAVGNVVSGHPAAARWRHQQHVAQPGSGRF